MSHIFADADRFLDRFSPSQRGKPVGYLVAVVLVMVALFGRLAIAPAESGIPFLTFFPAVTLVAVLCGAGPGLFAMLISSVLASYLFIPPFGVFVFTFHASAVWSNVVFCVEEMLVIFVVEAMYRQHARFATASFMLEKVKEDENKRQMTAAILRESEERLHAIAANVPGMVIRCSQHTADAGLRFSYVSNAAQDLLGIEAVALMLDDSELTGRIVGEHLMTFHDSMARSRAALALWNWEGCVRAADGTVKWINLRATPHRQDEDTCIWDGVVLNVTESKIYEEKLIHSQKMLRELAAHMESVREEERKHVAREIHDELGQTLTALKMDVSLARMRFGDANPELMKRLQSMTQLVGRTIEISRHITSSLRPGALDLGIVAAIEWLVEEFVGYTGIRCELALAEGDLTLDESAAIAVFRIIQESLTNISRHAAATRVDIRVSRAEGRLCFEVYDNGKGFDPQMVSSRKSFGLVGIRERMTILGGELVLDSEPGRGTRIRACFPVAC
ncbi:MAG: histidine kinase [Gallionella sp.]|nr:histidine kinase [Gallionella sp.]